MNIALWIGQGFLAAIFAASGAVKGTWAKDRLIKSGQTGVAPLPVPGIRLVALAELLAVLGLILPWATGILPALTPAAAIGLGVVMIGAGIIHARQGEPRNVLANVFLFAVCVAVAVGRIAGLG